jgi:hypothetical protein
MLFFPFLTIIIISVYSEDYYLNKTKPPTIPSDCYIFYDKKESISCTDIDYVMKNIVNITNKNTTVYIDSGIYNCSIISPLKYYAVVHFYVYMDITFILTGDISSPSSFVKTNGISTYPIILSNSSIESGSNVFLFCGNVSASFKYINFFIGNNSYQNRYFIRSLF